MPAVGFTLIELLTIIIILTMLIGLAGPSILEARKQFKIDSSIGIRRMIEGACENYRGDWGVYPPSENHSTWNLRGRFRLVQELTGYRDDDLQTGMGQRKVLRGRVLGPYNGTEGLEKISNPPTFVDSFGNEFFYYRFRPSAANPKLGTYDSSENADGAMTKAMGSSTLNNYLKDANDPNDPYFRYDYVLISPGPDRKWESINDRPDTDDITNCFKE